LYLRDGYVRSEYFVKTTGGSIAVQDEVGDVFGHFYPPVGPKRSVLIAKASCPSSTRTLETRPVFNFDLRRRSGRKNREIGRYVPTGQNQSK
jgi:hypothetical protein